MSASPSAGLVVGARYRLESVLGEGGMATVWTAVHTETDRKVALKLVKAEFVRDEAVREMFVREARVAARIGKNDHIVDVLDAGLDATLQVPFIAMELLDGEGLDVRIRNGPLPRALVADLLDQLGDALEQAHAAGVFHRDLKPQNVFLTKDRKGKPLLKVLDFGIAKLSESTQQSTTHVGTPAYAAPEQLGDSWRAIAGRQGRRVATRVSAGTDVWALGLVTFEMLTGGAPGKFWNAQTLAELPVKIFLEAHPAATTRADPSLVPPAFDAWLARCLDLDARNRWPSAREAVDALLPALRGGSAPPPVVARLPTPPPQAMPTPPPPQGPPLGTAPPVAWPMPHPSHPGPAIDPRVAKFTARWRAELRSPGDVSALRVWPVVYLPRVEHAIREVRAPMMASMVTVAEVLVDDGMRKAMGEERMLFAMIRSPRLAFRAALRSKHASGGLADGMSRGLKALDALLGAPPAGPLGDPAFEQHYEVWSPTPHEARAAIPIQLRHVLMSVGFAGIVERFPGAILITSFSAKVFDPVQMDPLLDLCGRVLAAIP